MMTDPVRPALHIEPRWTDLDPLGHVNNSVFLVYAEEARARYLRAAIPQAWNHVVVVHNSADYHSPAEASDRLNISSSVETVGTSSLVTVNLIATSAGRLCTTVRTVQVVLADHRRASRPWTIDERATLTALVDKGGGGNGRTR